MNYMLRSLNEMVSDQNIVARILLKFSLKCSWYIHIIAIPRSSHPENLQNLQEKNCAGVSFLVAGRLKKRL